jgi:RsiW-degrading membrane proteinase PrsW (M82 family)
MTDWQPGTPAPQPKLSLRQPYYWRVLVGGFVLYYVANKTLSLTGNINLVPTVILLGSFVVPVAYVTFLAENETHDVRGFGAVGLTFLFGGVLGTAAASLLEAEFVRSMSLGGLFVVGLCEEFAKLLGVVWLLRRRDYLSEANGIVFGAAAGMGFAAFETMGYGLTFLLLSHGNLSLVGSVLITRGLLSPFGHATWTALVASAIWRQRAAGRSIVAWPVLGAFLTAVILHTLWDFFAGVPLVDIVLPGVDIELPLLIIGFVGLALLYRRIRYANRQSAEINEGGVVRQKEPAAS